MESNQAGGKMVVRRLKVGGNTRIDIAEQILPELLAVIRDSVTANSPLEEFSVEDGGSLRPSLRFWRSEIDIGFRNHCCDAFLQRSSRFEA